MEDKDFNALLDCLQDHTFTACNDGLHVSNFKTMGDWCDRANQLESLLKNWLTTLDEMAIVADNYYHQE